MIVNIPLDEWKEAGKQIRKDDKEYNAVVKLWDLYVQLFHADAFGLKHDGKIVSYAAIHHNTRPIGDWGRYLNSYLVYTLPEYRRQGRATTLQRFIESDAAAKGYTRTKSLIQTYAGFRFHLGLGHWFWGTNIRGEIRCDSPIVSAPFPRGVPPGADDIMKLRREAHPLSQKELGLILQSPLYHQTAEEVERCFQARSIAYDPQQWKPAVKLV